MKKIVSSFIILSFILCFITGSYAADQLHRVTHNDQDALVLGQIISQKGNDYVVDVIHLLSGELDRETIKISSDFVYQYLFEEPQIDDFCILSLDKGAIKHKIKWGAYKADSGDYRSLKFVKTNIEQGQQADLAALEYYVNNNGEEVEFSFEENKAYVTEKSGDRKLIYPVSKDSSSNADRTVSTEKTSVATDEKVSNKKEGVNYIYIGLALVVFIVAGVIIDRKTNKR